MLMNWILLHCPDDAFMYLQLAKNPAMYLKTNGFQPLWAYIITLLGLGIHGNILVYVDCILYFGLIIAIPFVVKKLYNTWWGFAAWIIPTLFVGNLMMELALAIILILIAIKKKNGIWSALMIYARLDLCVLGALITIPWKHLKEIKAWKQFGIMCLCLLPYVLFNLIVFHTVIPDSMAHTVVGTADGIGKVNTFYWSYIVLNAYYISIPFIIIGVIGCLIKKEYRILIIEFIFLIAIDLIKNSSYAWHYTIIPVIIIFGYKSIWDWLNTIEWFKEFRKDTSLDRVKAITRVKVLGLVVVIGYLVLLLVHSWGVSIRNNIFPCNIGWYNARVINVDGTRGAFNAGIQGYFSNQYVEDTGGYFTHKVTMPEYFTDYSLFQPDGYVLIKDYGEKCVFGTYGLYKKVQ